MKNYIKIKDDLINSIFFESFLTEEEIKERFVSVCNNYDDITAFSKEAMNHKKFKLKINRSFLKNKDIASIYTKAKIAFLKLYDLCEKYHVESFYDERDISDEDLFELSNTIRNQILAKKYDMYSNPNVSEVTV